MLGDPSVFWFLRLLLFAILIICGSCIAKTKNKSIAVYLWIAIIAFALVEGLRWMRGTDYEGYLYVFKTGICEKTDPLYLSLVWLIQFLKINPTIVFVFLSGLFFAGVGVIFKNIRYAAVWGFPLIFLMLGYQAENIVRQYIAISFLGLAYYYYYQDKYKRMLLCLIVAPLFHLSGILGSVVFLFFTWKRIRLNYVWLFVLVYLAAYFLWKPEWLSNFALLLSFVDTGDGANPMSIYIQHADQHFTEAGSISAMDGIEVHRSIINIVLYFLTDIAVIITGFFACRNNQKLVLIYLFSYVGILSQILFGDIQILMRFGYWFSWMCPVLVAIVAAFKNYGKYAILRYVVLFLLFARYLLYGVIFQIGKITMEEGCMFIWDK